MPLYAASTTVSVENSKREIETTLRRYGATAFMYGVTATEAMIAFEAQNRRIQFRLPLPDHRSFSRTPGKGILRSKDSMDSAWEQACRQRWRALTLIIKAKLEAVEAHIVTFEDEFLAHIILPNGRTVSEEVRPKVEQAYLTGMVEPLLQIGQQEAK